jgi:hypothetical protein
VVKNNERGSAEGLSLAMVFCAISANLTYGTSIFMRLYSWYVCCHPAPYTERYLLYDVITIDLPREICKEQYLTSRLELI